MGNAVQFLHNVNIGYSILTNELKRELELNDGETLNQDYLECLLKENSQIIIACDYGEYPSFSLGFYHA